MDSRLGMYYLSQFNKTKDMQFLVSAYGIYVQMENATPGALNSIFGNPSIFTPEYFEFVESVEIAIEEWNPGSVFKLKDFAFIYNFFKDLAEVSNKSEDMWSVFDNQIYDELGSILIFNKLCHMLNYMMLCIGYDTYKTCDSNYAWGRFVGRTIAEGYCEESAAPDKFDRYGLLRNIKNYYKFETEHDTIKTILNRMLSKFLEASSKNHPELYKKLLELHMIETIYSENNDKIDGVKYETISFKNLLINLDIVDKDGNVKIVIPEDVFDTLKAYMENDKPNIMQLLEVKEKYKMIEKEFPNVISDWLYVDVYGENAFVPPYLRNIDWTSRNEIDKIKALKEVLDKILDACNCYNDILNNRGGK